ncbi:MAG: hypothetical protein J5659_03085 [Clostridia bacterium]|nr:hypothetical protein [Clostridia bacterium]
MVEEKRFTKATWQIMEQSFFRFDRSVNVVTWLLAAMITVLFTALVNVIALRKVKSLKLTDMS